MKEKFNAALNEFLEALEDGDQLRAKFDKHNCRLVNDPIIVELKLETNNGVEVRFNLPILPKNDKISHKYPRRVN